MTNVTTAADQCNLISTLNDRIENELKPHLPSGASVALIHFPNHGNVGDSAIWLGQKNFLRKLRLKDVYNCDYRTYTHSHMAERITDDTVILLSGGGNIGDVWPEEHEFREAIISGFPRNKIVQLPQSISFSDKTRLKRAKEIFEGHQNFTLFVRDKPSLAFARDNFACAISLCPDMALQLGNLARPILPTKRYVCLLRTDKETKGFVDQAKAIGLEPCDWLSETERFEKINRVVTGLWKPGQNIWRLLDFCIGPVYDMTARARFIRGLRILSAGKVVVTDRLHAHIFCLLMNIPHILLDNSYGKVNNFVDTWTKDSPLVHLSESISSVPDLLASICD